MVKKILRSPYVAIALLSIGLTILMAALPVNQSPDRGVSFFTSQPANAQWRGTAEAAQRVYEAMPELPLANEYVSSETGDANPENTFANRFVRYHLYIQRRSPTFRFDWKITLADYLGINDWMREDEYPGAGILRTNALDGDRDIVQNLSRAERDKLVQTLVGIFTPDASTSSSRESNGLSESSAQSDSSDESPPVRVEPGAADLLLP
ncbi:MAG TPA: hypothetical protein ACFE0H_01080 [Elainellaceae cyanobacterium]